MDARPTPWGDGIRPIVKAVVRKQLSLFHAFPDIGRDDLFNEGMMAAQRAIDTFDPTAGASLGTWVRRAVWSRTIDLYRSRARMDSHDRGATDRLLALRQKPDDPPPDDVAGWLAHTYRSIHRAMSAVADTPHRGKPATYRGAQKAAIVALRRRMRLSSRGIASLLHERPELRRAIRLTRVPSDSWIRKISKKSGALFGPLAITITSGTGYGIVKPRKSTPTPDWTFRSRMENGKPSTRARLNTN